jgi:hypothetical protein
MFFRFQFISKMLFFKMAIFTRNKNRRRSRARTSKQLKNKKCPAPGWNLLEHRDSSGLPAGFDEQMFGAR